MHRRPPGRVELLCLSAALLVGPASCARPDPAPTLLLVTVDTWRADRLGLYGSPRPTSPVLESIARDGVVFDRAVAPAPWTWPTLATLASGVLPESHGAVEPMYPLCDEAATLAEQLAAAGWDTHFAGINPYLLPERSGLRQGFDTFWAEEDVPDRAAVDALLRSVERSAGRPVFAHLHLFGPHGPFEPGAESEAAAAALPGPKRPTPRWSAEAAPQGVDLRCTEGGLDARAGVERDLIRYDAELIELDAELGRLRAGLLAQRRWQDAFVVITGDHGEEFCEHGMIGHGDQAQAEITRVPLVVRPPAAAPARRRVPEPVSLLDVPPTLLAAAGLPAPSAWTGRDLATRFETESARAPVRSTTALMGGALRWESPAGSLVWDCCGPGRRAPHLYAAADLQDARDLLPDAASPVPLLTAGRLAVELSRAVRRDVEAPLCRPEAVELDPDQVDRLRANGYLGD